ncbi:hypothetical protein BU15DRAFT_90408 [Melanogaster broomeanus]|nr:hypothetical protein BU15DRAFT_90408 [Melanogaster broomeanus]
MSVLTRTVAFIKTHALDQRLEIEPRILQANFEIVKERQMEFDTESDPETFYELFGEDAPFLGEGPVWVYVLERRRAVQVTFNPPPVPQRRAETVIAALFASSPPFPPSELPHVEDRRNAGEYDRASLDSDSSAVLEAIQLSLYAPATPSDTPLSFTYLFGRTLSVTGSNSSPGKPQFRARSLPKTHLAPDIAPRLTKAALLRQGLNADGSPKMAPPKTRMSLASTGLRLPRSGEKERARKTFNGVPGHKRADTISVASTAPPVIAPRMTKAAALRLGIEQPATPGKKRMSISGPPPKASGLGSTNGGSVPGHKRRETITVASVKPPTITPRPNRSSALRKEGGVPPSSFMFRTGTAAKTPGSGTQSRSSSTMSAYQDSSNPPPSWGRPRSTVPSRAASRTSYGAPPIVKTTSYSSQTSSSGTGNGPLSTTSATSNDSESGSVHNDTTSPHQRMAPRPASLQAPTITPRPNRSALLRAQKQAADAVRPKSWTNASKW